MKFGKAREALALWQKGTLILKQTGHAPHRLLTDVTGQNYTLVLESQFKSLADFEKGHGSTAGSAAWRNWYKKFTPLVESGRREIFQVVD